ncbi:hypothetical protein SDC9_81329 [bioreactor metagenome]|uniref:Uncharacterized protein n=1 Tax=bioreactor metagenome TaxID=1076179 RepID=A0A644Z1X6_9ZZZZ
METLISSSSVKTIPPLLGTINIKKYLTTNLLYVFLAAGFLCAFWISGFYSILFYSILFYQHLYRKQSYYTYIHRNLQLCCNDFTINLQIAINTTFLFHKQIRSKIFLCVDHRAREGIVCCPVSFHSFIYGII